MILTSTVVLVVGNIDIRRVVSCKDDRLDVSCSVGYRLAPEHVFPPTTKIIRSAALVRECRRIGGGRAPHRVVEAVGGNLAAVLVLMARDAWPAATGSRARHPRNRLMRVPGRSKRWNGYRSQEGMAECRRSKYPIR